MVPTRARPPSRDDAQGEWGGGGGAAARRPTRVGRPAVRRPIRVAWRSGTLGVKVDECPACGRVGPHRVERQYRWLELGPLGIVPLGLRHGLECASCWHWTPLPWRAVRRGVRARALPLPGRPRPGSAATCAEGRQTPDLDRVVPVGSLDGGTAYLAVWAVAVAILVGLALQPAGNETAHESSSTCLVVVGLAPGQPVPTPPVTVSETLCILPHNFEPLAQVPVQGFGPAATVPPYAAVAAQAAGPCASAFAAAFGSPAPGGPVPLVTGADARDWGRGDRFTWCAAADPSDPWPGAALPR